VSRSRTRRGQPVLALVLVLTCWVSVRAALWTGPEVPPQELAQSVAAPTARDKVKPEAAFVEAEATAPTPATSAAATARPADPSLPARAPQVPVLSAPAPTIGNAATPPRIAGGHQMLYLAGLSMVPLPPEASAAIPQPPEMLRASQPVPATPARSNTAGASRWSADGWILWRRGGNGLTAGGFAWPGGAYGASQLGAVVHYRLAPSSPARPVAYLRVTSAMRAPRGEELAAGLALRPLKSLPVVAMAEARATRLPGGGTLLHPAAALVSEFPPLELPLGLRGEAYVQAGWVGGRGSTVFVDGQARLERPLAKLGGMELRAGAGAWGGAQQGARRLDVGPTATLALPLGTGGGRLSADWRFRVAGQALPGSGPALTLSAGF